MFCCPLEAFDFIYNSSSRVSSAFALIQFKIVLFSFEISSFIQSSSFEALSCLERAHPVINLETFNANRQRVKNNLRFKWFINKNKLFFLCLKISFSCMWKLPFLVETELLMLLRNLSFWSLYILFSYFWINNTWAVFLWLFSPSRFNFLRLGERSSRNFCAHETISTQSAHFA